MICLSRGKHDVYDDNDDDDDDDDDDDVALLVSY